MYILASNFVQQTQMYKNGFAALGFCIKNGEMNPKIKECMINAKKMHKKQDQSHFVCSKLGMVNFLTKCKSLDNYWK